MKIKVVDNVLLVFLVFAIIIQTLVVFRFLNYGFSEQDAVGFILLLGVVIVYLSRKKTSLQFKVVFIYLAVLIALISGLSKVGILASAKIYVPIVPLILSFVIPFKQARLVLASYFLVFVVFAFLFTQGYLDYSLAVQDYAIDLVSWSIDGAIILVVSWGLLYMSHFFISTLSEYYEKNAKQTIELADQERRYRTLFEDAGDAIILLRPDGRFFDCNYMACEYFNMSREELKGMTPVQLSPEFQYDGEGSAEKSVHNIDLALQEGAQRFEWRHKKSDGTCFDASVSLNKIVVSGEVYIQAILKDITQQKEDEKELDEYRSRLEKLVEEKTEDLAFANEALNNRNEELFQLVEQVSEQRDELEIQKNHIEMIHEQLTQSIDYAQRIQDSILPNFDSLKLLVSDRFVFFLPKDIVSGDFYWWASVEGSTVVAAVDCTGHGVPGAFMSMLGMSLLREVVQKEYVTHPAVILHRIRKEVIRTLNQCNSVNSDKDGMDMSVVSIDQKNKKMLYGGANNPVYIVRNVKENGLFDVNSPRQRRMLKGDFELLEIKPDKMPVAIYERMDRFEAVEVQLKQGDQVYLFSDGYADQFGGADGKKFKYQTFREAILGGAHKAMEEQYLELWETFLNWKGDEEQVDDVVVLGLKI